MRRYWRAIELLAHNIRRNEVMKRSLFIAAALLLSGNVWAACTGSGAYQHCYDTQTGNSYNVQRYGNTTQMQGSNGNTGSSWSQRSTTIGNTTYHSGTASNGNSWNGSSTQVGKFKSYQGVDSSGKPYSGSCYGLNCK